MTVIRDFGGQALLAAMLPKIRRPRRLSEERGVDPVSRSMAGRMATLPGGRRGRRHCDHHRFGGLRRRGLCRRGRCDPRSGAARRSARVVERHGVFAWDRDHLEDQGRGQFYGVDFRDDHWFRLWLNRRFCRRGAGLAPRRLGLLPSLPFHLLLYRLYGAFAAAVRSPVSGNIAGSIWRSMARTKWRARPSI